jgi:hypothetical protein
LQQARKDSDQSDFNHDWIAAGDPCYKVTQKEAMIDDLPEELLDELFSFLQPQTSLTNATLTSRKLSRIVTPHLSTRVSLTMSRRANPSPIPLKVYKSLHEEEMRRLSHASFDVPTIDGCHSLAFIKTIKRRSELAHHVRHVIFRRRDQ